MTIPNAIAAQKALDELNELKKAKAIEFFAAAQAAQFDARLELDKSLLTLSSAGIAAFVALLTTVGPGTNFVAYCSCVAIVFFVIVIGVVLVAFAMSANYLEELLSDGSPSGAWLKRLDWVARACFVASVIASAAAGASIAKTFIEHKADKVAKKDSIDPDQLADAIKRGEVPIMESLVIKTNHLADYAQGLKATIAQAAAASTVASQATATPTNAQANTNSASSATASTPGGTKK
ncbi:hypothetical protein [Paraburkholderia nemoris]|uniref:Uncharacterized protein n=1 Tax=Paraburkholderia nemoris TaxID=2793076 RepID=A0ABN7M5N1_9BURK|nr:MULTISPECIES: hypothetical protein [Paraburkholderia]KPD19648.1 hypothetical protein ADM96_04140 [Burkholderia sp. ST111]MBK3812619.1 hypothetical protein [Paraburkholderia aspalathi]CAE6706822.1 hypothetical protein R75777_00946 [Paraburkholderia nemoris]CAE6786462.1 hypothetical protein R69776_04565 [Paraburkholderia nemoris]